MIALGVVLAAAAGCGSSPVAPPPCRLSEFAVSIGPHISEATGQNTLVLRFMSHGAGPCVLDGYPRLTLSDSAGAIPVVIRNAGDQMVSPRPPRPVVVPPRRAAWIVMNQSRCVAHNFRRTQTIRIDSPASRTIATSSAIIMLLGDARRFHNPYSCGKGDPGSIISVSPFVATVRTGLAH